MFVKYYAPNLMPASKEEWSLLGNIDGNNSEVDQSIYISLTSRQRFKSLSQILFKISC